MKDTKYCLKCEKPATWEKYGFTYCEDHVPEDDFDPEAAELDVIEWFKHGG